MEFPGLASRVNWRASLRTAGVLKNGECLMGMAATAKSKSERR